VLASAVQAQPAACDAEALLEQRGEFTAAAHPRTVCIINPDNSASLRVAPKLGYREIARADYHATEVVVLERCDGRVASESQPR
jgi:RimJ/RimL family protein N-acetyltransferase